MNDRQKAAAIDIISKALADSIADALNATPGAEDISFMIALTRPCDDAENARLLRVRTSMTVAELRAVAIHTLQRHPAPTVAENTPPTSHKVH